jgi:hypothetical protein
MKWAVFCLALCAEGETGAAFNPATSEDFLAICSCVTFAKAVFLSALTFVGLIGSFWHNVDYIILVFHFFQVFFHMQTPISGSLWKELPLFLWESLLVVKNTRKTVENFVILKINKGEERNQEESLQ